jgi:hypothetical protein
VWRNFKLRFTGALVASAVITTGAITAFSSGPSLAVLALQSSTKAPHSFSALPATGSVIRIIQEYNYSIGNGLTDSTPSNYSYQLAIPTNVADEASRVAAVFGVSGTPVNTNGDGSDWTITNATGSTLNYESPGLPEWYFNSSQSGTPASTEALSLNALPSDDVVDADVQHYMADLAYGYQLTMPEFGTSTSTTSNVDGSDSSSVSTKDVSYTVVVDGIATDQSVSFSFDSSNDVVSASGPSFNVASSTNYPLQSIQAGVAALNAEQQAEFPSDTTSTTSKATTSNGDALSTNSSSTPPIVNVTLDSESITLGTYELTDGSLWLLPVYNYSGEAMYSTNSSSNGSWQELAVDPSYIKGSANPTSVGQHGFLNF